MGTGAPSRPQAPAQKEFVSPFEADRSRKSRSFEPEMSTAQTPAVTAIATAVAIEEDKDEDKVETPVVAANGATAKNGAHPANGSSTANGTGASDNAGSSSDAGAILGQVLVELEKSGNKTLALMLESGSVLLQGSELLITVAQSAPMIDLAFGQEQKRMANAAAGAAAGRPLKVNVVSGAPVNGGPAVVRPVRDGSSARGRAANEPVVQRMVEKFGAEIRTVIDHREKS